MKTSFTLLRFPEGFDDMDCVYLENEKGGVWQEREEDTARYTEVFGRLHDLALCRPTPGICSLAWSSTCESDREEATMWSADLVFRWRKSSSSGGNGACVELGATDLAWRTSTFSGGNGECVEVACAGAVRDSKNAGGPAIRVHLDSLVGAVKAGLFDR